VVFNRSDTDTLDAVTDLADDSPLHQTLPGATGRSCAAIRAAHPRHARFGDDDLQPCDVCKGCPGATVCTPLTVGGHIIGSVLVNRTQSLDTDDERTIHESITQAAPVIANLRNLATAENQAATDALTGLPNKRSGAETLTRMIAQAHRSLTPLAALSIDLDHFKAINDTHGHGRGDEVLSAVGVALRSALRASDFAARNGGEEFLVLLPATSLDDATLCAQKIQTALHQIPTLAGESPISASIGVAVLPDHAHDRTSLEQAADRAVYTAKHNGRNRIETATDTTGSVLTIESLITT
jgi:diguanylate cyclase (GGDEF)-like protein